MDDQTGDGARHTRTGPEGGSAPASDDRPEGYVPALRFDRLTRLYDPVVALTTRERRFKRLLVDQCGPARAHRVLDLGCGTGTLAIMLAQANPELEVVGVDGDEAMLGRAEQKAAAAGVDVTFHRGLAESLPCEGDSFDRVVSSLFFHHLGAPAKAPAFREVHRVLEPGGELHVADWGRPIGPLMWLASWPLRLFDGLDNTRDNVAGRLSELMGGAGLCEAEVTGTIPTVYGTMALYRACKPEVASA